MTLKDKTYLTLKKRIITCKYLPGEILNERETIEELQISRTPFREAINALAHEGWLEPVPHKGIRISEITFKDVLDVYSIREQLEPFAVSLAVGNIPDHVLEKFYSTIKEEIATGTPSVKDAAVKGDEDFHKTILFYANNNFLSRMMAEIYEHVHRIRVLSMEIGPLVVRTTAEQHLKIINQMRERNINDSINAMKEHINSSKSRALDALLNQHSNFTIGSNKSSTISD